MRILLAGKNSFIGRSIIPMIIQDGYDVLALSREECNFTDTEQVMSVFKKYGKFDCCINLTANGGRKFIKKDTLQDFHDNVKINENLINCKEFYSKMLIFGSGASFGQENDINLVKEGDYKTIPTNYYGLSKYVNSKRAKNESKISELVLFNCFGPLEKRRFINYAINYYINKKQIEIWNDIYLDFFYIDDLFSIIKYVIKNNDTKELNCCYKKKYKMSEAVEIINNLSNYKVSVIINSKTGNNYCGNGDKLNSIKEIKLKGLKRGIIETYNKIKKENNG